MSEQGTRFHSCLKQLFFFFFFTPIWAGAVSGYSNKKTSQNSPAPFAQHGRPNLTQSPFPHPYQLQSPSCHAPSPNQAGRWRGGERLPGVAHGGSHAQRSQLRTIIPTQSCLNTPTPIPCRSPPGKPRGAPLAGASAQPG